MHQYDLAGQPPCFAKVVCCHDDLDTAGCEGPYNVFYHFGGSRVEACRRLVQEKHCGIARMGSCERQTLLLAPGQSPCRAPRQTLQADELQKLPCPALPFVCGHAGCPQ